MNVCLRVCAILVAVMPTFASAQELVPDTSITMRAKVLEIIDQRRGEVPGTDFQTTEQTIRAEIIDGPEAGAYITFFNDVIPLSAGETFYLSHVTNSASGDDYYQVYDRYRLPQLGILMAVFVAIVLFLGGKQGARGLLALLGSLLCIFFLLLPGLLRGYSPIAVAVGVSAFIVVLGSYITHGFNRTTSAAVIGMILTVALSGALAYVAIPFAHLSGFSNEEAVYLNINFRGSIDLAGLLIGSILIGSLGVLYDAAIGQAVTVEELMRAAKHYSKREIYKRAVRIGREHIGALVNTLAIAYVGAALPLLLLFYGFNTASFIVVINREIFATEIVRAILGSIGLVLAVPITTLVATYSGMIDGQSQSHTHDQHKHTGA